MKNWFSKHFQRYMIRPAIYKTFSRFILALTFALLWNHFVSLDPSLNARMYAFVFLGVFFGVCAWLTHLRMDGLHIPRLNIHLRRKRDPARTYGDMMDYTDEEIVSFDELEDEEKDVCCLLADLFCCVAFLLISFL